jgi:hypothetical protein
MTELHLDPGVSRLIVRTRAGGMLARLAHDLEIVAKELDGRVRLDGDTWSAELHIPVAGLHVAGTLRGERLDPRGLSAGDRREVERRMRVDALRGTDVIRVQATGASRDRADVRVTLASGTASLTARLSPRDGGGGLLVVPGSCQLSQRALGVPEIKGPLGAFKICDALEILFDFTLRPAG